jgi:hypothetical protein
MIVLYPNLILAHAFSMVTIVKKKSIRFRSTPTLKLINLTITGVFENESQKKREKGKEKKNAKDQLSTECKEQN